MRTNENGRVRPEYWVWRDMKQRCLNPRSSAYYNYGARGITVCDSWLWFSGFFESMGSRPTAKHTLERLNNDGPYSPENCLWAADRFIQNDNSRNAHRVTYQGETHCVAWWCRKLGLSYRVIQQRVGVYGWSVEEAFTTPKILNHGGRPCV